MAWRVIYRLSLIAGLLVLTLLIGTAGFSILAHYPVFDAFYMTLTTITTVGYQEVHPLNHVGRVFNSFLILFGVSAMFFSVGVMTETIIELQLHDRYGRGKRRRMVQHMKNHYIVCGFGRVGRSASHELKRSGVPFLVLDRSEQRVARATDSGMVAVVADATSDASLREAGIMRACGFISALPTDAENVFVILSAKTLNPKLTVVTRAAEEGAEEKLRRAGADIVFSPYSIAGQRLAQALVRPHVAQFIDFAAHGLGLDVSIEEFRIPPGQHGIQETLSVIVSPGSLDVIVLAVRKRDGQMVFNPPAEAQVGPGDFLIVMGRQPGLRRLEQSLAQV
jgi:voltage-gated potassium channel